MRSKKKSRRPRSKKPSFKGWRIWVGIGTTLVLGGGLLQLTLPITLKEKRTWRIPLSPEGRRAYRDSLQQILPFYSVWHWLARFTLPKPGYYELLPSEKAYAVYRRFRNGLQTPIRLYIPPQRSAGHLARFLGRHLAYDSLAWHLFFTSFSWESVNFSKDTWLLLFIPDLYEVYWTISPGNLIYRLKEKYERFWTETRKRKAEAIGLSPVEVGILASIIEWETSRGSEKPLIAGVYLNRLRLGMPLQADPTVLYATGDFSARRVTSRHTSVESPYNTYKRLGLPPGPIGTPSPESIDAVLDYTPSNYLYFCARPDGSGYHDFSVSYAEHIRKARLYQRALTRWLASKKSLRP